MPNSRSHKKYISGNYTSKKTGQTMHYRSSWELEYMRMLDNDNNVISYHYEKIQIPYIDFDGIEKIYIPDFFIKFKNNKYGIHEVKPKNNTELETVKRKQKSTEHFLKEYLGDYTIEYKFITEEDLPSKGYWNRIPGAHIRNRRR